MRSIHTSDLEVRLARNESEIDASLALRYQVFYEEGHAQITPQIAASKRDFDPYDSFCQHLLVIDHARSTPGNPCVVGTYRLLDGQTANQHAGFYSEDEFNLDKLIPHAEQTLELGRSCVHPDYRTKGTMQLLWRGIADYVFANDIQYLFGCASFPGTNPDDLALPLSYLYHNHLAPEAYMPHALKNRATSMNLVDPSLINPGDALRALPPLIKGYLRIGGMVGNGAVVDTTFNTVDVCMIVNTDSISEKYRRHFAPRPLVAAA